MSLQSEIEAANKSITDQVKPLPPYWLVQHFSQRDNPDYKGAHGWQECFNTSVCMRESFTKKNVAENADFDQMKEILDLNPPDINGFKAWQVHSWWCEFLKTKGYMHCEAFPFSKEKANSILKDRPFVLGTWLSGSGHMVLCIDKSANNNGLWLQDPYGRAPYLTAEDKNWKEPYFKDGFDWIYDKNKNPAWSLDVK